MAVSVALAPDKSEQRNTPTANAALIIPTRMPETQAAFNTVVEEYKSLFSSASNELQQAALRDQRRDGLLRSIGARLVVTEWVGTLRKLETNGDGNAIVTIRIAPNIDVATWNNSLSDVFHSTLIAKGSALYSTLMNMAVGDQVTFSGTFLPGEVDGFYEQSLTIRGAMEAPEFLFRFTDIRKL